MTLSRSPLVFHQSRVTFSSPDVTPASISCLFSLFVTLHGAFPVRLAASHLSQSWYHVGLLAGENNGRIEAVWERDSCSGPHPAVGSVTQWTALGSVHCCLRDWLLNPSCYSHEQKKKGKRFCLSTKNSCLQSHLRGQLIGLEDRAEIVSTYFERNTAILLESIHYLMIKCMQN